MFLYASWHKYYIKLSFYYERTKVIHMLKYYLPKMSDLNWTLRWFPEVM